MGKLLIIVGIVCIIIGVLITYAGKLNFPKLPGDLAIEKENFRFYFPITTCIIVSVVISIILFLINRWKQ